MNRQRSRLPNHDISGWRPCRCAIANRAPRLTTTATATAVSGLAKALAQAAANINASLSALLGPDVFVAPEEQLQGRLTRTGMRCQQYRELVSISPSEPRWKLGLIRPPELSLPEHRAY